MNPNIEMLALETDNVQLTDISLIKVAIEICNSPELKGEILCAPESEYEMYKGSYEYDNKKQWNEIVGNKAKEIIENSGIANQRQEELLSLVLLVGERMLIWAEYHEVTFDLSREYSVDFLNSSFFTEKGIIDSTKTAESLLKDESLTIEQKYKLACLYCFRDRIPALYRQITNEDKEQFYDAEIPERIRQPEIVKFWTYYLMSEIDMLRGKENVDKYRLQKAVESGTIAAVDYCFEKTKLKKNKWAIVDAAIEAVKCKIKAESSARNFGVLQNWSYIDSEELWTPSEYYVDILSFLLSKMAEDQRIEFLKKDVKGTEYDKEFFKDKERSRVLDYFLNWPYQNNFMETAILMWEFLPVKDYASLVLRICDKINLRKEDLKYSEEKCYDYRELLKQFWCQSPERYKRYVFGSQEKDCIIEEVVTTKAVVLTELLTLKNLTYQDRENIKLILASVKCKEDILSSETWKKVCIGQMKEEKWITLNEFVINVSVSKEEENKLKKALSFTNEAKRICIDFMKNGNWNAAESFIKWSSLPEEEINELKIEMIYSEDGCDTCVDLILSDEKVITADQFIRWCFPSEEEEKAFKKELVYSLKGISRCVDLITGNQLEVVNELIKFCLSSEREVRELKGKVANTEGGSICEKLISGSEEEYTFNPDYLVCKSVRFKGGKWEEVEKFLTWCFSSEEEINDFKKNKLLKEKGTAIHFKLIEASQWEEAERFFAWLGLSAEEIHELKKDTLFHYNLASKMFKELIYCGSTRFVDYGSREEGIELLLRWYLTDRETVLEFQDLFESQSGEGRSEKGEVVLEDLDLMIEQRLKDLDEEEL